MLIMSDLTDPASRKAKPACMKKIKRETTIKKNWSLSFLSSSNFSSTVSPLYELSLLFTEKDFSKTMVVVVVVVVVVDVVPLLHYQLHYQAGSGLVLACCTTQDH